MQIAKASKQNFLELEHELSEIRKEMALHEPTDDAYKVLAARYNEIWKIKTELEKSKVDRKRIIASIATPFIGVGVGYLCREVLNSAFWRDLTRELTKFNKF